MSTNTRPELSTKNPYWIEKHRYYELKHFCLQYYVWKKIVSTLDYYIKHRDTDNIPTPHNHILSKPVEDLAVKRSYFQDRIDMVERVCKKTDPTLSEYILDAVTKGLSYDILRVRKSIPCNKAEYYELYRKFFWLLDKERA